MLSLAGASLAGAGNTVSLVPSTTNGGRTTVQGQVTVTASAVPEPATAALFLTAAAAYGLRRRFRARG